MKYIDFLRSKMVTAPETGFVVPESEINPALKPHQRDAVRWAVAGGRRGLFERFGLGKTAQELEYCRLVTDHEGGKALIVLPLGVRQEFMRDAVQLLGMEAPRYVRNMEEAQTATESILLTNYERVRDGDIDPAGFTACCLDEASVLRSFGSKTYQTFLDKFRGVRFKLVATATPSPNRYKELIHYAGFLEIMDTGQALTRFFQRDSTKANNLTLYPHKEEEFWLWVSTWGLFLSKPSDLGYDDTGYALPPLDVRTHILQDHYGDEIERDGQVKMMRDAAVSLSEAAREKRESIAVRVAKAKEIVDSDPDAHFILWHDLEAERHAIKAAMPETVDIYGSMDYDEREPRVIMLENVEEFQTWGPVRRGHPIKSRAGQTFRRFIDQLEGLGYAVEWRELVAADYGAPTTRKRFFLIARRDGRPIVWPEPSHAPADSPEVKAGKKLPWRSAAEIIDWSVPSYSVFASKAEIKEKYGVTAVRPLSRNTMRRIIRGVDKFTIKSGTPFLVECNHGGDGHTRSSADPINTLTGKYTGGVCEPVVAPFTFSNTGGSVGGSACDPVHTVRTAGGQILASANLMSIGQTGGGDRVRDARDPAPTCVSKQETCMVAANLIQYHTEQTENVRANGVATPLPTVDAANRYGLTCANLVEYFGNGAPLDVMEPMHTVTSHDREAVVAAHIQKFYGGVVGEDAQEPLPTVTAVDHNALCAAHVVEFKGQDIGQEPQKPLRTITASAGEFAACNVYLAKMDGRDMGYWPKIRELLNEHCGYSLKEDEVLLLQIGGSWYFISDITLRMLTPRELYNAMVFPPDYIIDRDYLGNAYGKSKQVAWCGNAVPPPFAEALVRANLPEWCGAEIRTMEELEKVVAV